MTIKRPDSPHHDRVMARAQILFDRIERELRLLDEFRRTQKYIASVNYGRRKGDS